MATCGTHGQLSQGDHAMAPISVCLTVSLAWHRGRRLAAVLALLLLAGCAYMRPDGSDWHRTRKVSLQACMPGGDPSLRAVVALHRHVDPALQRAGFQSVLGGIPYPAKDRTAAGDPVFFALWEAPSNAHHLITVQLHGKEGAGAVWSFRVPAPSEYKVEWSDWVLPMDVPPTRMDAPRIRYRLEFPREYRTDKSPIPACRQS